MFKVLLFELSIIKMTLFLSLFSEIIFHSNKNYYTTFFWKVRQ